MKQNFIPSKLAAAGLTIRDAARLTGVTERQFHNYLSGKSRMPVRRANVLRLALGVSIEEILEALGLLGSDEESRVTSAINSPAAAAQHTTE